MRWIRFLVFVEADAEGLGAVVPDSGNGKGYPPVSPVNEVKAWTYVKNLCKEKLERFDGSLEEDLKLLKDPKLPWVEKNIITVRASERKVYLYHIKCADIFTNLFSMSRKEANLEVNKMKDFEKEFAFFKRTMVILK